MHTPLSTNGHKDDAISSTSSDGITVIDANHLIHGKPRAINYVVDGFLPVGTGDLFGPPGSGKSSLALNLSISVASRCGQWMGRSCIGGTVVMLGGERGSIEAFQRDLHRARAGSDKVIEPGSLLLLKPSDGNNALWQWDRTRDQWMLTSWGSRATEYLAQTQPVLIVLDTIMSVATGCNHVDVAQQYALGETIQEWSRTLGSTTLTISHTNQASASEDIDRRLHYLSRSGGNGFPGSIRWIAGMTQLRHDDRLAQKVGLARRARKDWLVALGTSKTNEMPRADWNHDHPAIFHLRQDGSLDLIMTGQEVRARLYGTPTRNGAQSAGKEKRDDVPTF